MSKFSLWLTYSTCKNAKRKSQQKINVCQLHDTPSLLKKNGWQNTVLLWCMLQRARHLYTTTAPSCCIPASYCHLSATLQTISIIVLNLYLIFYPLQLINTRSCNYSCTSSSCNYSCTSSSYNYSCTSSWWWVSTPETCRAAYRNAINWIQSQLVGQLLN